MAQRTIVELTDDLTGDAAEETVTFGIDGKTYEIDLSEKNASALREALAAYVSAGRRAGGSSGIVRPRSSGKTNSDGYDPAAVRAWASSNGHAVSSRGRVSKELVEAFKAAGN